MINRYKICLDWGFWLVQMLMNLKSLDLNSINSYFIFIFFKVKKLQVLPITDRANCLTEFVKTKIGLEALEFYLTIASQDAVNELLKLLASQDFLFCAQIITELARHKELYEIANTN